MKKTGTHQDMKEYLMFRLAGDGKQLEKIQKNSKTLKNSDFLEAKSEKNNRSHFAICHSGVLEPDLGTE